MALWVLIYLLFTALQKEVLFINYSKEKEKYKK